MLKYPVLDLLDNQLCEPVFRQRSGITGILALFEAPIARIVVILMRLGASSYHGVSTGTEKKNAQKVGARYGTGMNCLGHFGCHFLLYPWKHCSVDNGWSGILHFHRRIVVVNCWISWPTAPDKSAAIGLIGQDFMHNDLSAALSVPSVKALFIYNLGDFLTAYILQCHAKHSADRLYSDRIIRIRL